MENPYNGPSATMVKVKLDGPVGQNGPVGQDGQDGQNGPVGQDGQVGQDGPVWQDGQDRPIGLIFILNFRHRNLLPNSAEAFYV